MAEKRRPRRGKGEGTIHQRPNGTWCVQINLDGSDSGRRRATVYAKTYDGAVAKALELRRQKAVNGDLPTSDMTVGRWLDYWLTEIAAKRLKPATYRSYKTAVNQHIKPSIGRIRLGRLTTQHVRMMHASLTGRDKPLSSTTALNAHRILSAALNDAVRDGRVGRNIAALVRAPSRAVSRRTGLTTTQTMKIMGEAGKNPQYGSTWLAAFLLGIRQGERLGLRWPYVDIDAGLVDVSWSLQRVSWEHGCTGCGRTAARICPDRRMSIPAGMEHEIIDGNLVLLRPKTRGSQRIIAMPEPLVAALNPYAKPDGFVWAHEDGRPFSPVEDYNAWRTLLERAGVPHVTLHEARHTTATLLLESGVDVKVIGSILGHSDIVTTRGYQHVSTTLSRAALDGLARQLGLPAAAATASP